jgi:hypothetical protein
MYWIGETHGCRGEAVVFADSYLTVLFVATSSRPTFCGVAFWIRAILLVFGSWFIGFLFFLFLFFSL